jgi:hypothetical protein
VRRSPGHSYNARGDRVADLLECLIQIRALEETSRRLARLVAAYPPASWQQAPEGHPEAAPVAVLGEMLAAEQRFGEALRTALGRYGEGAGGPSPPPSSRGTEVPQLLASFHELRRENLALLAGCSAADLARLHPTWWGGRGTVADLVAEAVASDTERVGNLRRYLEAAAHQPPREGV